MLSSKAISLSGRIVEVSPHGHILVGEKTLAIQWDKNGYGRVQLGGKWYLVHRIVASAFLGLDIGNRSLQVHHKDGNKGNNAVDNLEILSRTAHAHLHKQKHPVVKRCCVCGKCYIPAPTKRARSKLCSHECWARKQQETAKTRRRAVEALDESGVVKQFASITEAAAWVGKNGLGNITKCCQGKLSKVYGYYWRYAPTKP